MSKDNFEEKRFAIKSELDQMTLSLKTKNTFVLI
jgi:hypothetical protein